MVWSHWARCECALKLLQQFPLNPQRAVCLTAFTKCHFNSTSGNPMNHLGFRFTFAVTSATKMKACVQQEAMYSKSPRVAAQKFEDLSAKNKNYLVESLNKAVLLCCNDTNSSSQQLTDGLPWHYWLKKANGSIYTHNNLLWYAMKNDITLTKVETSQPNKKAMLKRETYFVTDIFCN